MTFFFFFFYFGDVIAVTNFSGKNLVHPQMGLSSYAHVQMNACVAKNFGAWTEKVDHACPTFMAHPTRIGRRVGALHKKLGHPWYRPNRHSKLSVSNFPRTKSHFGLFGTYLTIGTIAFRKRLKAR